MTNKTEMPPASGGQNFDISSLANAAEAVKPVNERLLSGESIDMADEFPELHSALKLALKQKDPKDRSEVFIKNLDPSLVRLAFEGDKSDKENPGDEKRAPHHGGLKQSNQQKFVEDLINQGLKLIRGKDSKAYALWEGKLFALDDDSGADLISLLAYKQQAGMDEAKAVMLLKAKARHEPDIEAKVHKRVASPPEGGHVYIDLADGSNEVIHVSKEAIKIEPKPEGIYLYQSPSSLPMARPDFDADFNLEELLPFFNITNLRDLRLIWSWAACAMLPTGPHPILHVIGTAGSAKSEMMKKVRRVIDPNNAELRVIPEGQEKLRKFAIAVQNNQVLIIDNLKHINESMADVMCIASTGGNYVTRGHFSNLGEVSVQLSAPIALTSIGPVTTASDLLDRMISMHVPPLQKGTQRSAKELDQEFEKIIPKLMALMCRAIQHVLLFEDEIDVSGFEIRMMDFQKRIAAMAPVFGWDRESAMKGMVDNTEKNDLDMLDNNILYKPIMDALKSHNWSITGKTSDLLEVIASYAGALESRQDWPKGPQQFAGDLAYIEPSLKRIHGILYEPHRRKSDVRLKTLHAPHMHDDESTESDSQKIQRGAARAF